MRREERSGCRAGLGHPPEQPLLPLCPRLILPAAALGLRSGDSRVLGRSSGTRDSPAGTPRGSALGWYHRGLPHLPGAAARFRAAPAPPRVGPGPCPVAHAHSPAASQPSACGSSALLEIITSFSSCCFYNLLLSPAGVPEPSLPPSAQLCALRAPERCPLQPASERLCHRARPAPAQSFMSLLLLLLLPFGLGLARGGRGEVRRGHRPPGTAPGAAGGSRFAPSHHLTSI